MAFLKEIIKEGWLKTPRIIEAFKKIKRIDFLPDDMKDLAELNEALPIGFNQTISQPLVVAFMLEQLQPEIGDKILDVGAGSGWTSALLAHIVSQNQNAKCKTQNNSEAEASLRYGAGNSKLKTGKIIAIEVIPELKIFGEQNVAKYNYIKKGRVEFICADGSKGYLKEALFDKILASAAAGELPPAWKEQIKIGGRIVAPIGSSIWVFNKKSEKEFQEIEYPGFIFVPLRQ